LFFARKKRDIMQELNESRRTFFSQKKKKTLNITFLMAASFFSCFKDRL
jgi:hypothetical protein